MENKTKRKLNPGAFFRLCPVAHSIGMASALVIVLHLLARRNHALMASLSERFVRPLHGALARLNAHVSFSVAELLIVLTVAAVLVCLAAGLVRLLRGKGGWQTVYRGLARLAALLLFIYAGFSLMWGVYYYGDDFAAKSGLKNEPVSPAQLETVTRYFAGLANDYSTRVERDANGCYTVDRAEILRKSTALFDDTVDDFPCLDGPRVPVKPVRFSRGLSLLDFTGFFFPFTGEANVNTDFPPSLFASTVAHELSHQRGVAKEQEANFTAVLACLNNGDADYCYSAALLAYTHLGNALYSADREAWREIDSGLNENVMRDFVCNNAYWAQFETPVQSVSNTVYEGLLFSYGQQLGLKSYGACVDLLVNYYYESALSAQAQLQD